MSALPTVLLAAFLVVLGLLGHRMGLRDGRAIGYAEGFTDGRIAQIDASARGES